MGKKNNQAKKKKGGAERSEQVVVVLMRSRSNKLTCGHNFKRKGNLHRTRRPGKYRRGSSLSTVRISFSLTLDLTC